MTILRSFDGGHAGSADPDIRTRETDLLVRALDGLRRGGAPIAQIVGAPGAGKSRLLEAVTREAGRRGLTVLRAHGSEVAREVPFSVFAEAFKCPQVDGAAGNGAPPSLAWVLDEMKAIALEPGRAPVPALALAVRDMLTEWALRSGDGLVVALDDFHWADAASLSVIECLISHRIDSPLLVALALRPQQMPAHLVRILGEGVKLRAVEPIELRPLSLAQSAELLGMSTGDDELRRLHGRAEGNPLYLHTQRDRDAADAPPGVVDAFTQRLLSETALLGPHESLVASAAAVLGDHFDPDMLSAVAELGLRQTAIAVEALCRRDLLHPLSGGHELTFRHELVRDAFYNQTDYQWRVDAHRRAMRVLSARWAPSTELALHVEHSVMSADGNDVQILMQAAQDVIGFDPDAAARWMNAVLRILPGAAKSAETADLRVHAMVMRTRALTADSSASAEELSHLVDKTLRLLPRASSQVRADAINFCCLLEAALTRHVKARTLVNRELRDLRCRDAAGTSKLLVTRGMVDFFTGGLPDSGDLTVALRLAHEQGFTAVRAGALALRGVRELWLSDSGQAARTLAECAELVDGLSDSELAAHPEYLAVLGWAEALMFRFRAAERHLTMAFFIARHHGDWHLFPVVLNGLCFTFLNVGRLAEANRILTFVDEACSDVNRGTQKAVTRALLVCGGILTDAREPLEPDLDAAARIAEAFVPLDMGWAQVSALLLANAALIIGDGELCASLITGCGGPGLQNIPAVGRPAAYANLAVAALRAGRTPGPWAEQAAAAAQLPEQKVYSVMCQGLVAEAAGDYVVATAHYGNAAAAFAAIGMVVPQMFLTGKAASCSAASGYRNGTAALFSEARQLARHCGAERVYQLIAREADSRERLDGPVEDPLAVLTEREREIAVIASGGQPTREIASQLRVSPRTVDVHLSRIYRKLNVNSRAALAARVVRILADPGYCQSGVT